MEHDPAVIAGVSLAIETVIAKAVELSPGTQSRLKQLHPLTIEIHCTQPALEMFVSVEKDGGIQIASYRETKATVSCLLYTSPSPRDVEESRMPSSA